MIWDLGCWVPKSTYGRVEHLFFCTENNHMFIVGLNKF